MATSESDEVREMYCEPCYKDGIKNTKAVAFCTNCVEYLCATCARYHKKHLSKHELKNEVDMPKDYCFDLCSYHPVEILKFYCMKCNNNACAQCKQDRHANCADVKHLPDIVVDFENSLELKGLEKKIMKAKKNLKSLKRIIAKGEEHTDTLKSGVSYKLQRQRENFISQFDHFAEEINKVTLRMYEDDKAKLQMLLNEADTVGNELVSMDTDLCNMKKGQQRCKLFIKAKKADQNVDKLELQLKNLKDGTAVQDYSYHPFENGIERPPGSLRTGNKQMLINEATAVALYFIFEFKMACQLVQELPRSLKYCLLLVIIIFSMLGIKVLMFYILLLIANFVTLRMLMLRSWVDSVLSAMYHLVKNLLIFGIKVTTWIYRTLDYDNLKEMEQILSTYISVKTKDNNICNITGVCFLSPIHVAAVDNYNSSVKLINIERELVISELKLGEKLPSQKPWDVTKISSEQLAVTIPLSEIVCFIQLKRCFPLEFITVSVARTMLVQCHCYGIVYHNNKFIISCADASVKIIDLEGHLLQDFYEGSKGERLFSSPYYVNLSIDCNSLYVSDYGNETVTMLSMDGAVLAIYSHENLRQLFGMTVDNVGNVYVCGYHNIFKLSEDLSKGHQVLENVNRINNNVAYCGKTNSLWIACHNQNYIKHHSLAL